MVHKTPPRLAVKPNRVEGGKWEVAGMSCFSHFVGNHTQAKVYIESYDEKAG
jgi:hypothetical protein